MFIDENTVSTIVENKNGKFILTMYSHKKPYFTGIYKTMASAKSVETRLINKRYKTEYRTIEHK